MPRWWRWPAWAGLLTHVFFLMFTKHNLSFYERVLGENPALALLLLTVPLPMAWLAWTARRKVRLALGLPAALVGTAVLLSLSEIGFALGMVLVLAVAVAVGARTPAWSGAIAGAGGVVLLFVLQALVTGGSWVVEFSPNPLRIVTGIAGLALFFAAIGAVTGTAAHGWGRWLARGQHLRPFGGGPLPAPVKP